MTIEFELFGTLVLPILIMLAKIVEVSMGTLRIMFVSRGIRLAAVIVGFFEVLIWLAAIGQVMQNLSNIANYIAYAIGFSIGNYTGILIEEKISLGHNLIRIITKREGAILVDVLREEGYVVTDIDATGNQAPVKLIFTVVRRKKLKSVIDIIKKYNPRAFYTIEDMRFVNEEKVPLDIMGKRFLLKGKPQISPTTDSFKGR